MDFLPLYLTVGLVILGLMTLLWLVSFALKNSSIVDIFWGTGFVIVTWVVFVLTPDGFVLRKWLLNVLVTIWGLRLSLHILARNWGKPEDFRYQAWRKNHWRGMVVAQFLQSVFHARRHSLDCRGPPARRASQRTAQNSSRGSITSRFLSG